MGLSNSFATIPGFLAPAVVGILTENNVRYFNHFIHSNFIN